MIPDPWQQRSDSVISCDRIPEQWNLRRHERKCQEKNADQADRGKTQLGKLTLQPILFECPPFKNEDKKYCKIKDHDVDPVRRFSECSVEGIEQDRDQRKSQQNF